ncbi:MAG TPA: hypothetical protein VLG71_01475 [Candidatus Limnocylindria bacterium]|nr:hypothetical protein [Candidatus Limnocylindria bacterium]
MKNLILILVIISATPLHSSQAPQQQRQKMYKKRVPYYKTRYSMQPCVGSLRACPRFAVESACIRRYNRPCVRQCGPRGCYWVGTQSRTTGAYGPRHAHQAKAYKRMYIAQQQKPLKKMSPPTQVQPQPTQQQPAYPSARGRYHRVHQGHEARDQDRMHRRYHHHYDQADSYRLRD